MNRNPNKWPWVRDLRFIQDKNLPLYRQLQNEIKSLIDNLYWDPGERIPTEAEICEGLGMSINTVKKGLHGLVIDGYLVRRPGLGTFVASTVKRPGTSHPMVDEFDNPIKPITSRLLSLEKITADENIALHLNIPPGDAVYLLKRVRSWGNEPISLFYEWIVAKLFPNLENIPENEINSRPMVILLKKYYGIAWRKSSEILSVRKPTLFAAKTLKVAKNKNLLFLFNKVTMMTIFRVNKVYFISGQYPGHVWGVCLGRVRSDISKT